MDPEKLVRRVIGKARAERAGERARGIHVEVRPHARPCDGSATGKPEARPGAELVSVDCLAKTPDGGTFRVPGGARITPLAQEEAFRRGIRLAHGAVERPGAEGPMRVAVGSDHGGYRMKQEVLDWVRELGHRPVDLGCHDENTVDYPDLALEVAQAVAEGRCDAGILVDGAGIGSAMAANKVPGVRAANCHDVKMAGNAREHNFANVLTLGGRMIDAATAHAVVRTFLATPFGAERHGRRVEKIHAIEARYRR